MWYKDFYYKIHSTYVLERAMAQSTVFSQVIKLISRQHFDSIVSKYQGNKGVRSLECWTWFGAMLLGQLTGHDSIRAIERVFAHSDPQMKKKEFT